MKRAMDGFWYCYFLNPSRSKVQSEPWVSIFYRASLAIIYVWFGAVKFSGLGPANELVTSTVSWLPPAVILPLLGAWEIGIGIGLLIPRWRRYALPLLFVHLAATTTPLLLFPDRCFITWGIPSMTGQYILKNLVFFSVALGLWERGQR